MSFLRLERDSDPVWALNPASVQRSTEKKLLAALEDMFEEVGSKPIAGKTSVRVENLRFDERRRKNPDDLGSQRDAKVHGKNFSIPLLADVFIEEDGKVIDKAVGTRIADLPIMTNRLSYLVRSPDKATAEVQMAHLMRQRHGLFTTRDAKGKLTTAATTGREGIGQGFRFSLTTDETGAISFNPIKRGSGGYRRPPMLYPILKKMGVSDSELEKSWGEDVLKANKDKWGRQVKSSGVTEEELLVETLDRLADHVYRRPDPDLPEKGPKRRKYLLRGIQDMELDPLTSLVLLGKRYSKLEPEALAAAAKNLVETSKGDRKADDRISLAFQKVAGPDDLVAEPFYDPRVRRSIVGVLRNKLSRGLGSKKKKKKQVSADKILRKVVSDKVRSSFLHTSTNDLSSQPPMVNPIDFLSEATKITPISQTHGGLKPQIVKFEQKLISPSHLTFLDPLQTPESDRSGVTLHMAIGAKRASRGGIGVIESELWDAKERKLRDITPAEVQAGVVAYPDQYTWTRGKPTPKGKLVNAQHGDRMVRVSPEKVDYVIPRAHQMFTVATNLVPFLESNHGNRVTMATKQIPQAVSLVGREAPMVQVKVPGTNNSFEESLGQYASVRAPVSGRIKAIDIDKKSNKATVTIKPAIGRAVQVPLYYKYPLREHSMLHSEVRVKVGDRVKKGSLLADTNFSKDGALALGRNLFVAYLPWKGRTFEDGIVISESASKKLTSKHMYEEHFEVHPKDQYTSARRFASLFKDRLRASQIDSYEDGVIQKGSLVEPGQPIATLIDKTPAYAKRLKGSKGRGGNVSQYWEGTNSARVVDVIKKVRQRLGKPVIEYTVLLETEEPAEVGDKIVSRHAAKGVITAVVEDAKMPKNRGGKVVDVLLNPAGIPSRVNIGQVLETGLAKVVEKKRKTDKGFVAKVENFSGRNNLEHVLSELKSAKLSDQEVLLDPDTGKPYPNTILAGPQYIMKLKHQVAGKLRARNAGKVNPTTGSPSGDARRLGELNFYSMLAHGARENLEEMIRTKSGGPFDGDFAWNSSVYDAIVEGSRVPRISTHQHPVWDKFDSYLNVMGVDLEKNGESLQVLPLTDNQFLSASKGSLDPSEGSLAQYSNKGYKEQPGSLYDPAKTGGIHGHYWSHYKLPQRFPKPIYAKSIAYLLGLTQAKDPYAQRAQKAITEVVEGDLMVDGKTGPEAIVAALEKLDVNKELKESLAKSRDKELKIDDRDYHTRRVRVLRALKAAKVSPVEAYTTSIVPVVPPKFRPIRDDEDQSENALNRYYMAIAANLSGYDGVLKDAKDRDVKISNPNNTPLLRESRGAIYEGMKALHGLVQGPSTSSAKRYLKEGDKGILESLIGTEPKESFFQREVLKRRQDFTAGSVIIPEPTLGLDEIGIPEDIAWSLYEPFVVKRLVRAGKRPIEAKKLVNRRDSSAMDQLKREMESRPILFKRDPTLHKYGIMAFRPRLNYQKKKGDPAAKSIQLHPLVTAPLNADFDGDQGTLYLPLEDKAKLEAYRMMPSANLFGPATNLPMFVPSQEALLGLYMLSRKGRETGKSFKTNRDVTIAYKRNELRMDDIVTVAGKKATPGRLIIDQAISAIPGISDKTKKIMLQHGSVPFSKQRIYNKKVLRETLGTVGEEDKDSFAAVADTLKNLGYAYSTRGGFSVSLEDFRVPNKALRDKVFAAARRKEDRVWQSDRPIEEKELEVISLYKEVDAKLEMSPKGASASKKSMLAGHFGTSKNRLFDMIRSGSRGDTNSLQQMIAAPVLVMSAQNKVVPVPILRSYSEGLDAGSYMTSLHGARKGIIQKVQTVRDPGMVSKHVMKATMDFLITEKDCKTKKGIPLPLRDSAKGSSRSADLRGRFLSTGGQVTEAKLSSWKQKGQKTAKVRSPLTCEASHGLCAKCVGISESGELYSVGTNIGVISGQSLGEPLTQLSMRVFHGGGLAKGKAAGTQNMFLKLQKLVDVREKPSGEHVPVAEFKGKVSEVTKLPSGIFKVKVDPLGKKGQSKTYKVVPFQDMPDEGDLLVDREPLSVGTVVNPGDKLAKTGEIHPLNFLEATGDLPSLQDLLVDEIHGTLVRGANGDLLRKHTEVVVRALTDRMQVTDSGEHPELLYGDIIRSGQYKKLNKEAGGKLKARPMLLSAEKVPRISDDFLVRLQATELKQGILDAAQYGFKSYTNSYHPVPAYGWGAKFNQSPNPAMY